MSETNLYIRMKNRINADIHQSITVKDVAQTIGEPFIRRKVENLSVYTVRKTDHNFIIIDVMQVIEAIQKAVPNIDVQTIGPAQTIVEVKLYKRKFPILAFLFVWLLLFFGSGLTIMNFHEDVSMQKVHQKIYYMITGQTNEYPLLLQIPYSFGIGLGMILFFNHVFKKKFNEEPSPLEIEMFNYQQDLNQYLIVNETKEGENRIDGS